MGSILLLANLSGISAQRRAQADHDYTASRNTWNSSYDFIVVGAGSAGCVVANRLAATGKATVLLLEAGGGQSELYHDIPAMFTIMPATYQWGYTNGPQFFQPGVRLSEPKGKVIGGTSSINAMIYNRGNKKGFDEWEYTYGATDWRFDKVLPYFKKLENNKDPNIVAANPGYYGTSGPVQVTTTAVKPQIQLKLIQAYKELGFSKGDINGANQTVCGLHQRYIATDGFRSESGNAYVDPNQYPQNLHIVVNALVVKILFTGTKATGVQFYRYGLPLSFFSSIVMANKKVVVCAG